MERKDIVAARNKYLREMDCNLKSDHPRPEVYLDETWVNQNACVGRCWTSKDGSTGPCVKRGKGARFIVVDAGGSQGFIPDALLMFKSKFGNKGDYHDSMNHQTFKNWFVNQLLPNIPAKSWIIHPTARCSSARHSLA